MVTEHQTHDVEVCRHLVAVGNGPSEKRSAEQSHPQSVPHDPTRNPRIGCAGIIRRGQEILLGRRDKEPARGLWVLPGGGVDFGETFADTLRRELVEEAGIQIEVEGVFKVYELVNPPDEHRIIVYLNARHREGEPMASSDLSDIKFFDREQLKEMSASKLISPFVDLVLRNAALI